MATAVVTSILLRDVVIDATRTDCLVVDDAVAAIGTDLGRADEELDGGGGALLPGLADHHLHLFAMAAAAQSFDLTGAASYDDLATEARRRDALRVVGWDDESLGDLDRDRLDVLVGDVPVRVQQRSGALWVLNSAALAELDESHAPEGAERDRAGRLTGKVWRADEWLRSADSGFPDLTDVGRQLASYGVTSVTDATPDLDPAALDVLAAAVESGALPQRLQVLGAPADFTHPQITIGPWKIVVADHSLPSPDELAVTIAALHDGHRAVAVHCVSRAALAITIAAFRSVGSLPGDRIEHCAVADAAALAELAALEVTVVTQPSLIARRGDDYLDRHQPDEHADLWRYRSLLDRGICTVASSDAPYGDPDPWATIRAARDRAAPSGRIVHAKEQVDVRIVLNGLWAPATDPAGPARRIAVGEAADLVLLSVPLDEALRNPSAEHVAAAIIGGHLRYRH